MKRLIALLSITFISASASANTLASESIFDHWVTEAGDGIVEIKMCEDESPCGISTWVDPEHGLTIDSNNPDESLRGRSLVGSKLFWGYKAKGDRWTSGKIYNPKDGNTYKSKLALTEDGKLKVKGCVGPICKSLIWTRAEKDKVMAMTSVSP